MSCMLSPRDGWFCRPPQPNLYATCCATASVMKSLRLHTPTESVYAAQRMQRRISMLGSEMSATAPPLAAATPRPVTTPSLWGRSVSVQAAVELTDRAQTCGNPLSAASRSASSQSGARQSGSTWADAHAEGGGETEQLPLSAAVTAWLDHAVRALAAAPSQGGQSPGRRSPTFMPPSTGGPADTAAGGLTAAAGRSQLQNSPAVKPAASSRSTESQHRSEVAGGMRIVTAAGSAASDKPQAADGLLIRGPTSHLDREGANDVLPFSAEAAASVSSGSVGSGGSREHVAPADAPAAAQLDDTNVGPVITMETFTDEEQAAAAASGSFAEPGCTERISIAQAPSPPVYPAEHACSYEQSAAMAPHSAPQAAGEPPSRIQPQPSVADAAHRPLKAMEPTRQSSSQGQSSQHVIASALKPGRVERRPPLPPASAGRRGGSSVASGEGRGSSLRALKLRLSTTRGAALLARPQSAPSGGAEEPLLQPRWNIAQPRSTSPSRDHGQARLLATTDALSHRCLPLMVHPS